MKGLDTLSKWLVVIGGLNWGLVGIFKYDLVASLLGGGDAAAAIPRVVYTLVGLAAVVVLVNTLSGDNK